VLGIGDNDGSGASAAGNVDYPALILGISDESFDWLGVGRGNGNDSACRYHISEADVYKFHNRPLFIEILLNIVIWQFANS
jgi:hypothetical protein